MNLANKTLVDADYLASLNPAQRTAALETEGPVLILAGAGTGKTRVLTTRLAYILQNNLAYPSQILAVTFTNKATCGLERSIHSLLECCGHMQKWLDCKETSPSLIVMINFV